MATWTTTYRSRLFGGWLVPIDDIIRRTQGLAGAGDPHRASLGAGEGRAKGWWEETTAGDAAAAVRREKEIAAQTRGRNVVSEPSYR